MILNDAGQMVEKWYYEIEKKFPDGIRANADGIRAIAADTHIRPDKKHGIDNNKYGATIGDVMTWFKTMTTNEYIRGVKTMKWECFNKKLWQRNFYEHIIRDCQSYHGMTEYINNNPAKWQEDTLFQV